MNRPTRILAVLALSAFAGTALAQQKVELKVVANDAEGAEVASSVVTVDSQLRFTAAGVDVYNDGSLEAAFPYADMSKLTFSYDTATGMAAVDAAQELRLRNNPVAESLEFVGFTGESACLSVADLSGAIKVYLPEWRGNAVDVSDFTPGLYFVTVDKTTFKFIKK